MKTVNNSTAAVVSGGQESARLTIEANGKAFKELISGIYSDKPYAIARELIANAIDSHVAAGHPERPFEMHLPTVFEPVFSIRDYGTSMTHDQVMTLYRTLFRSSKDDPNSEDSNKFVGKFGLGSKSPFAYTDAFQLTAFLDGRKRIYDIYFNAGAPMITLFLDVEMTDDPDNGETIEEDGILISFPVNPKDCDAFAVATTRAIEPLTVDPIFTGRAVTKPQRTVIFEGDGWQLLDGSASGSPEALQGTVLYPLRASSIPDLPAELAPLFSAPFRVTFDIGQLDVITSREALSFDEATTKNIIARFETIRDEIRRKFEAKLSSCQTYFEFCTKYYDVKTSSPSVVWNILDNPQTRPRFRDRWPAASQLGGKFGSKVKYALTSNGENVKKIVSRYAPQAEICVISTRASAGSCQLSQSTYSEFSSVFKAWDREQHLWARTDAGNVKNYLVLQDITERVVHAERRIKALTKRLNLERVGDYRIIWVKYDPKRDTTGLRRIYARFGRMPIEEVMNLVDMPFVKPEGVTRRHAFKVMSYGTWTAPTVLDERRYAKRKRNIYYVHILRERAIDMGNRGPSAMEKLWKDMENLNIVTSSDSVLIGIPPKSSKSRGDVDPSWIDFRATVEQVALSMFNPLVDIWDKVESIRRDQTDRTPWVYNALTYEKGMLRVLRPPVTTAFSLNGTYLGVVHEFCRRIEGMRMFSSKTQEVFREFVHPEKKDRDSYEQTVNKVARKLVHQMNVIGGKACEEFPELIGYALDSPSSKLDAINRRRFRRKLKEMPRHTELENLVKVVDELVKMCQ